MKQGGGGSLEAGLRERLGGSRRLAVVGIGDECRVQDRMVAGALKKITALDLPGTRVFSGGAIPETVSAPLRRYNPDVLLFIVAAETGRPPGDAAIVEEGSDEARLYTDHYFPLGLDIDMMSGHGAIPVVVLAFQPDAGNSGPGLSPPEKDGIDRFVAILPGILSG